MKLSLLLLLLTAVVAVQSLEQPSQDLESIADFIAKVKEIYSRFKTEGIEFVCSAKLHELLDILGLPDDLDGAVEMAQSWLCGSTPTKRSTINGVEALEGEFIDNVKKIWEALKNYSKDLVCTSKLQDLLDTLGLPDQLDGAVSMAQKLICRNYTPVKRSNGVELQGMQEFIETVRKIWEKLTTYSIDMVCTSKLQDLLDLLGLPDQLDGAVKMAQGFICGNSALVKRSADVELQALQGFIDTVKAIWESLKKYSTDLVCTSKLQDLLDILGLPDQLDGAVKMAQDRICRNYNPVKRSTALVLTPKMELQVLQGFHDTAKVIYGMLKEYVKFIVCSSRIHQLLDLLGLPDELDGAVELAQKWICGTVSDFNTALASENKAMDGFFDIIKDIYNRLLDFSKQYVCGAEMAELLASLDLPAALTWAVNIALGWIC